MKNWLAVVAASFLSPYSMGGKLVFVTDPWCPFACEETHRNPGFMIEISKAILEAKGYTIEYKTMPFSRAVVETEAGRAHAIVGIQNIPIRKNFIFPEVEQGLAKVCFYGTNKTQWRYQDMSSLKGVRIGTISAYSYGPEIDLALKTSGALLEPMTGFQALTKNIRKLNEGRIDTLVEYDPVVQNYLLNRQHFPLKNLGCSDSLLKLYVAFSPQIENSKFLSGLLGGGMKELKQSGKLKQILKKYGLKDWPIK